MKKILLLSFFYFQMLVSLGQMTASDTAFIARAKRNVITSFTSSLNSYARLYNGRAYDDYKQLAEEHPYLFLDWSEGSVEYFGKTYENVPLLFDLTSDEIITEHSSGSKIALLKNKVNYFTIKGHRYEYIRESGLAEGFYDILYSGSVRVIVKHQKKRREKISGTTLEIIFDEQIKYYVIKEDAVFSISNKRSLIKILSSTRPDIKKRLSLDVHVPEREQAFVEIASLYDRYISGK